MSSLMACIAGMALDAIFGDPVWLYHPVRIIGNWISILEKWLRGFCKNDEKKERIAGCVLWFGVVIASVGIPWGLLYLVGKVSFWLQFALETFWCYQLLAGKCLKDESRKVYVQLVNHNLEGARHAVYKAVNTMDSMVGYKNEKYLHFGRFAAKMDDVWNYIPSRISALLMIASAWIFRMDYKRAWAVWKRDRRKHASPNSAQTEAVCAGALQVQLAGDAYYFGKLYPKETIGDDVRPIEPEDILRAGNLMDGTALLTLLVFGLLKYCMILM